MTRLALLSDLHANLGALEAVESDLLARAVDRVVLLGDLVGYLTRPDQVAARVAGRGWPCLQGNYDLAVLTGGDAGCHKYLKPGLSAESRFYYDWTCDHTSRETLEFLAGLPPRLSLEGGEVLAVHGSPDALRDYVFPDRDPADLERWLAASGARVVCLGHTHIPFVRQVGGGLVVNPGSVGRPKDGDPRASYALLTLEGEPRAEIIRVAFDVADEARRLVAAGFPPETAQRFSQGL